MSGIIIQERSVPVKIRTSPPIAIQDVQKVVCIVSLPQDVSPLRIHPFSFTATSGQTTFPLSPSPKPDGMFVVAIGGIMQFQANGDFTISNGNLIFDAPLDAGDLVGGIYEMA